MTPTPRPWKERRDILELLRLALLKAAAHDDVELGFSAGLLREAESAIDESTREIDRRGELIGKMHYQMLSQDERIEWNKIAEEFRLRNEQADEVSRG